jgi:addiction module HigA family antidote
MNNTRTNEYHPDYLVSPGEILNEYLEELGMTQAELANRTGLAKKTINEIIKAKSPITPETALKLERSLGRPARFWSNLERQYQDNHARVAEKKRMESHLHWLENFPVRDMVKLGWIPKFKDKREQLEAVLKFFGIASPDQWIIIWENTLRVSYRQTKHPEKSMEAITAWLRQGEIQAKQSQCPPYDNKKFQESLDDIRKLTVEADADIFLTKLSQMCLSAGVIVVLVPALPNMGIHGATRWISDRPVIQLSFYLKTNDQFWFSFFHEAGHIIKHGRRDFFLEGSGLTGEKEKEADSFAQDKLIPPILFRRFLQEGKPTLLEIKQFAKEIGIASGIVLGRLQHDKIIPWNEGSNLKVHYQWNQ